MVPFNKHYIKINFNNHFSHNVFYFPSREERKRQATTQPTPVTNCRIIADTIAASVVQISVSGEAMSYQ